MDEKKHVWLYCRVHAGDNEHDRLKLQKKELMDYGGQLGFEVVGVSQDTGIGLDFDQKGIVEVREAATAGKMDVLLIANLSRLAGMRCNPWNSSVS